MCFAQMDIVTETFRKTQACRPANNIAERNAKRASRKGSKKRKPGIQMPPKNQVSGKEQQRFVRYGKARNAQHQEAEKAYIAILRDPAQHGMHDANRGYQPIGLRYDFRYG